MAVRDPGARLGARRAKRATAAGVTALGRGGRQGSTEPRSALERAERIGEALREVGSALGRVGDLDVLLRLILTRTTEVLEADRATLYLVDGDRLVSRMLTGGRLRTITLGLGEGIAGHVARTGRPVRVRDAQRDPRFDPRWDRTSGYRTRSMLAAPLKNHLGRTVGVLQVLNKRGVRGGVVAFTARDTELLSALAAQAALSLDQAELIAELVLRNRELAGTHQRLERSLHQLSLLLELETAMNRATTWRELAEYALGCAARACEAEGAALAVETTAGRVTLFVVSSSEPGAVRELPLRPGEGIAGEVMQSGDPMRLVSRPREPRRVREALGRPLRCAMAAALAGAGGATRDASDAATEVSASVGAIVLYNRAPACGPFAAEDAALLRLIAANVATELRLFRARAERERSERLGAIGQLLSSVLHDLTTPLTVIRGYTELIAAAGDPTARALLARTVDEQFELIGAMQRDLLAYARGEKSVIVRHVVVPELLSAYAERIRPELAAHRIELVLDVADRGAALFDRAKIERALDNLVRNAIDAMPRGGTLTLGAERTDEALCLWVRDTGPGVPRSVRARMFEPFVTVGKRSGTGLGLSIVKAIAEEHGGGVELETSPRGSTFTLSLPQRAPSSGAALARRAPVVATPRRARAPAREAAAP